MAKYRCAECNQSWDSSNPVDECPHCGELAAYTWRSTPNGTQFLIGGKHLSPNFSDPIDDDDVASLDSIALALIRSGLGAPKVLYGYIAKEVLNGKVVTLWLASPPASDQRFSRFVLEGSAYVKFPRWEKSYRPKPSDAIEATQPDRWLGD